MCLPSSRCGSGVGCDGKQSRSERGFAEVWADAPLFHAVGAG